MGDDVDELCFHLGHLLELLVCLNQLLVRSLELTLEAYVRRHVHGHQQGGFHFARLGGDRHHLDMEVGHLVGDGDKVNFVLLASVAIERLHEKGIEPGLLETDAPVVYKWGTESAYSAEPSHTTDVLKAVAELKGIEADVVAQKTTENAIIFFELSDRGVE